MYENILVPLDGSELAEKALSYAKSIAKLKKSNLILFAVSLTIFVDRRDRLFTSYLETKAKELNAEKIKASTATGYGDVAEEITKYADANKMNMIVMATHGYSGAKQLMFGSISQKVLYSSKIPVLLVKPKSTKTSIEFNKILLPVDGSPFSESTFPYAEELARKNKKELLILHICEPPVVPSYGTRPINATWKKRQDEMWSEIELQATNYLKKKTAALKKQGVQADFKVIRAQSKEVSQTILKVCKEENVDLIIMATQGRTGVSRWVYGGVANRIVRESTYPVLLIRPEKSIPSSAPDNLLDDIWQSYITGKT